MKESKGQGCFRKFMTQSSQFLEIYRFKKISQSQASIYIAYCIHTNIYYSHYWLASDTSPLNFLGHITTFQIPSCGFNYSITVSNKILFTLRRTCTGAAVPVMDVSQESLWHWCTEHTMISREIHWTHSFAGCLCLELRVSNMQT